MIALDTSAKIKKSSKKSLVHTPVVKELKESESEGMEDSDVEEAGPNSPNEEIISRKSDSEDDETSSGIEGDESVTDENEPNHMNDKSKANPGWADAMKKILNTKKPKKKKSIVLSKAKKLNDIVPKPKEEVVPFEVETIDGKIKKETIKIEENINEKIIEQKKHRKKEVLGIRIKPSVLDREREKRLQKIATNGVVQLFNAVRQQQKEIEEKLIDAGPLERKREKALKNIDRRAFLDVLMGGTNNLSVENNSQEVKEENEDDNNKKNNKVWSVLRDDFVMGAKLKDWNKHGTDDEKDSSAPEEMDSD